MPNSKADPEASPFDKTLLAQPSDICVFAPWPLFTVTIEHLASGEDEVYFHAGGQALWVARMVRGLEQNVAMVGPFGGEAKPVLETLVQAEGIRLRSVPVKGANGGYINDRRDGERKAVANVKPPRLDRHEVDDLYNAILAEGLKCGTVVITGVPDGEVLPVEFFCRLVNDFHSNGVKTVADVSGTILDAIEGGLTLLRASSEELIDLGLAKEDTQDEMLAAMEKLRGKAENIVIGRAGAGCLALLDGKFFEAKVPNLSTRDHTGAGDSMTAACAVALAAGMSHPDALRLATAAAAMNVTRHGRGTGKLQDIEVLAERVDIQEVK